MQEYEYLINMYYVLAKANVMYIMQPRDDFIEKKSLPNC